MTTTPNATAPKNDVRTITDHLWELLGGLEEWFANPENAPIYIEGECTGYGEVQIFADAAGVCMLCLYGDDTAEYWIPGLVFSTRTAATAFLAGIDFDALPQMGWVLR